MNGLCGTIFDIKELTVHDGPGVRVTVFMKGCPLRCLWCHNPEGLSAKPQMMVTVNGCVECRECYLPCPESDLFCENEERCVHRCPRGLLRRVGSAISAAALAERLHRIAPLLTGGGVTLSGGEPLWQPHFLLELLARLKPLHTVVETSGYAMPEVFRAAADACDTVYLDIKHPDDKTHCRLTGVGNTLILENLAWLKTRDRPFLVRVPLIPGCNDDPAALDATADLLRGTHNLSGVEILPMNPFTKAKYKLFRMAPTPWEHGRATDPAEAVRIFQRKGLPCRSL